MSPIPFLLSKLRRRVNLILSVFEMNQFVMCAICKLLIFEKDVLYRLVTTGNIMPLRYVLSESVCGAGQNIPNNFHQTNGFFGSNAIGPEIDVVTQHDGIIGNLAQIEHPQFR